MIHSLIHTSAPKTLSGGSGFGVVAKTEFFPTNSLRIISNASGYQFSKQEMNTNADYSTILFAHWSLPAENDGFHVVTRVAPCGNDQSGRPNRIAQHIVFESTDQCLIGPAEFASTFKWVDKWDVVPGILPPIEIENQEIQNTTSLNYSESTLALLKNCLQGRCDGHVLQLDNDSDPLQMICAFESISDSRTRWAMKWAINTPRNFSQHKHRLIISVKGNPVETEISNLALPEITLDGKVNAAPKIIESNQISIPPDRLKKKYQPPSAPLNGDTESSPPEAPTKMTDPKEMITTGTQTPTIFHKKFEDGAPTKIPAFIAFGISLIALSILTFVIIQNSDKNQTSATNTKLHETTDP